MTEEQMKSLRVGDICKDVEVSGNYGIDVFCKVTNVENDRIDVFCKVTNVENDRIEIDCIEDNHCNAYPLELFYRTDSWRLEKL